VEFCQRWVSVNGEVVNDPQGTHVDANSGFVASLFLQPQIEFLQQVDGQILRLDFFATDKWCLPGLCLTSPEAIKRPVCALITFIAANPVLMQKVFQVLFKPPKHTPL